jgi:hypothetical protein
MSSH